MNKDNFRLYSGSEMSHYGTMKEAKEAAKSFMPNKPELRIEIIMEMASGEADWWAYNYETKEWEPS